MSFQASADSKSSEDQRDTGIVPPANVPAGAEIPKADVPGTDQGGLAAARTAKRFEQPITPQLRLSAETSEASSAAGDDRDSISSAPNTTDESADTSAEDDLTAEEPRRQEDRLRALRAERSGALFAGATSFGGHAAGRDVIYNFHGPSHGVGESRPRIGPVHEERLAEIRATYVKSECYGEAQWVLADRRILILSGPVSCGKQATALALLSEISGIRLVQLESDLDLERLSNGGLRSGCGHIVDSLRHDRVRQLGSVLLAELSEILKKNGSYLILTVTDSPETLMEDLPGYVVACDQPPPQEVFRKHLAFQLGDAGQTLAGSWIEDPVIAPELDGAVFPRQIAELVAHLVQAHDKEYPYPDAVAFLRQRRAHREVRDLLGDRAIDAERSEGLRRRAFLISLAVLHGLPYPRIVAAADLLESYFHEFETGARIRSREIFRHPRDYWLQTARAVLVEEADDTANGKGEHERVQFANRDVANLLLRELWEQYAPARSATLSWLKGLVVDGDAAVRLLAAQAVGILSTCDFEQTLHGVIAPWASSGDQLKAEAAAWALEVAAYRPDLTERVRRLLDRWCSEGDQGRQRAAAVAYGTEIGAKYPADALRNLRHFARTGRMLAIVGRSITDLFVAERRRSQTGEGPPSPDLNGKSRALNGVSGIAAPTSSIVVATVADWLRSSDKQLRRQGAHCFLRLTYQSGTGLRRTEPALLRDPSDELADWAQLVEMWRVAFATRETRRYAWAALRGWITRADANAELVAPIASLLTDLFGGQDERAAAQFYLRRWSADRNRPSTTSAKLLDLLSES